MQTTIQQSIKATYTTASTRNSIWTRFASFCKEQEENRLLWLGIILAVHGCILTPITVMLTLIAGPNFTLFMIAMASMGIALVTNLAAMPTKITIPAFALSVLIDLGIVAACVVALLS